MPVPEIEAGEWPTGDERARGWSRSVPLDALRESCGDRHDLLGRARGPRGYADSGLPARTMGRALEEDPLLLRRGAGGGRALAGALEGRREGMERVGGGGSTAGRIVDVRVDEFRHDDGETAEREIVVHPGAVAIVAHDERLVYLVRQPREAVGEAALLELPAGKLDVEGEAPLEAAQARARARRSASGRRGGAS